MPRFTDLLAEEVRRKKQEILAVVSQGLGATEKYRSFFEKWWHKGVSVGDTWNNMYGVDGGSDATEISGGGVILFARALALSKEGKELRKLLVDAFYPKSVRDYEDFIKLVREHVEHLAALEALEEGAELLLIDGSLYGRMIHVIRELDIPGREDFVMDYVKTYSELLSKVLRNGVVTVGVSKDSRSTILKEEVLYNELASNVVSLSEQTRERVLKLWRTFRRAPNQAIEEIRKMVTRGGVNTEVYNLFLEARSPIPDSKVISALNLGEGFSTPLKLSLSSLSTGIRDLLLSDSEEKLINLIAKVFKRTQDKLGEAFIEKTKEIIGALKSYPPVLTSYTILGEGDDPLRVDLVFKNVEEIPCKCNGEVGLRFASEVHPVFISVVKQLKAMYAGRRCYNVLLLEVDRRVKVTRETLEAYTRILSKELGELVVHSRGERRVSYP
ncbi:MAG: DNA double-strand break repair nuclease NurA [Thermofilaceae archaeon]